MTRIKSFARYADGVVRPDISIEEVMLLRSDPAVMTWTDIEATAEKDGELARLLEHSFLFHAMSVDNALRRAQHPRLDDWGDYICLVLHAVDFDDDRLELESLELDIFVGRNYIVTCHEQPIHALNVTWDFVIHHPRRLVRGVDNLLYQLIDNVLGDYLPILDYFDEWQTKIESEIFEAASPKTLATIFRQKRALIELKRAMAGKREVLGRLSRDELAVIDEEDRHYFRDLYEHLVRLHEITESLRDLTGGALETYLSVQSQRTNDIMKTLTVFTVFFMPLSFITGFFGMNFFGERYAAVGELIPPSLAYATCIGSIVLTPLAMYLWMRRKGWTA
jgi:magnesium transporter